jgi:uncharacterized protein with ATP-grasp and redox domains
VRQKIENATDPLLESLAYARVGNYIDFGAMNSVDENTFLSLFDGASIHERDKETVNSFVEQCACAKSFLPITDNCGEIVLDKLFLEQLKKKYPSLEISVMVRGGEVLNDATEEDAMNTGIDKLAKIISSGNSIAGTVYEMLPDQAKEVLDRADVVLAKGQGNYETLSKQGRHIFYSFLCKCNLFTNRFEMQINISIGKPQNLKPIL